MHVHVFLYMCVCVVCIVGKGCESVHVWCGGMVWCCVMSVRDKRRRTWCPGTHHQNQHLNCDEEEGEGEGGEEEEEEST